MWCSVTCALVWNSLQSALCQLKTPSCFSVLWRYPLYLIDVNDSITLWEALFPHWSVFAALMSHFCWQCVKTLSCNCALKINLCKLLITHTTLVEHTTGLCKSYEDKHSALQDRLRETSLRRKYFCLFCPFLKRKTHVIDDESCLLWGCWLSADWLTDGCHQFCSAINFSWATGRCVLAGRLHSELQWTEGGEWSYDSAETAGARSIARLHRDDCCLGFCWQV